MESQGLNYYSEWKKEIKARKTFEQTINSLQ